jgi:hypothetical protein
MFYAQHKGRYQSAYNITTVIEVDGALSRAALVSGCHRLVAATPALRIRMGLVGLDGELGYWFSPEQVEVEAFDLPSADSDAAHQLIDSIAVLPFESDGGPLTRFAIVRTAADRAYLALICHHLVVDGPSQSRLLTRLGQAVEGDLAAEQECHYAELVRQVRALERDSEDNDLAYWDARLPDSVEPAGWRSDAPGAGGGRSQILMPAGSAQSLHGAASVVGVRPFHLMTAAVHSSLPGDGTRQTVISTGVSIRPLDGSSADLVGYFVNGMPLLAYQRAGETPRELAVREGPRWRDDLRRRYISFAGLAARATRRQGAQSTLDQVLLSYRTRARTLTWRGSAAVYTVDLCPKFFQATSDLVIRVFHDSETFECDVQWSPALPPGAGEQFTERLRAALAGI